MSQKTPDPIPSKAHAHWSQLVDDVIPRYIKLLHVIGIRDPGNYYHVDHYRRTINLFLPLSRNQVHPISIHVSERQWSTPISKANEHFYACVNSQNRIVRKRGFKVKARMIRDKTFFLVCFSYTRNVKGVIRKDYKGQTVAALVIKKGLVIREIWQRIYNYFSKRLQRLTQRLKEKRVDAYGDVKVFKNMLTNYCELIRAIWLM